MLMKLYTFFFQNLKQSIITNSYIMNVQFKTKLVIYQNMSLEIKKKNTITFRPT